MTLTIANTNETVAQIKIPFPQIFTAFRYFIDVIRAGWLTESYVTLLARFTVFVFGVIPDLNADGRFETISYSSKKAFTSSISSLSCLRTHQIFTNDRRFLWFISGFSCPSSVGVCSGS